MKYENTRYKLKKIWTDSITNKYQITAQEDTNALILEKEAKGFEFLGFKKETDFSTEWEQMTLPSLDSDTDAWYTDYRVQWNIEFEAFPVKLIPFIKYNVVYKFLGEEELINDGLVLAYPRVPCIFRVEDLETDSDYVKENIKKVTMIVGYLIRPYPWATLQSVGKSYDIQAKLLIKIYNPEFYI